MKAAVLFSAVVLTLGLGACSFAAQECCDCMATKQVLGDCMREDFDTCVERLSQSPPDTDVISPFCRSESDGYCQESCADILYKK